MFEITFVPISKDGKKLSHSIYTLSSNIDPGYLLEYIDNFMRQCRRRKSNRFLYVLIRRSYSSNPTSYYRVSSFTFILN